MEIVSFLTMSRFSSGDYQFVYLNKNFRFKIVFSFVPTMAVELTPERGPNNIYHFFFRQSIQYVYLKQQDQILFGTL